MPQFGNAPAKMNEIMESVYNDCKKGGGSEEKCSRIAIGAAKRAGFAKVGKAWKKITGKRIK